VAQGHAYIFHTSVAALGAFNVTDPADVQSRAVRTLQGEYLRWATGSPDALAVPAAGDTTTPTPEAASPPPTVHLVGPVDPSSCTSIGIRVVEQTAGVRAQAGDFDPQMPCVPAVLMRFEHKPRLLLARAEPGELGTSNSTASAAAASAPAAGAPAFRALQDDRMRDAVAAAATRAATKAMPTPYEVLVTDRRLYVLHSHTNEVVDDWDLYDWVPVAAQQPAGGGAVAGAGAGAPSTVPAIPGHALSADAIAEAALSAVAHATDAVTSGVTTAATRVAAGVGAGLNRVVGFVGLGRGSDEVQPGWTGGARMRQQPLVHVRSEGPVLVMTSDKTGRGFSLLCTTAEEATALRRSIVAVMRGAGDRSRLRRLEAAAVATSALEARLEQAARVRRAVEGTWRKHVAAAERDARLQRIVSLDVPCLAAAPSTALHHHAAPAVLLPSVPIPASAPSSAPGSEGVAEVAVDELHAYHTLLASQLAAATSAAVAVARGDEVAEPGLLLQSTAFTAPAPAAPAYAIVMRILPHAPAAATPASPGCTVVVIHRTYGEWMRLWHTVPPEWHDPAPGRVYVPRLPDLPRGNVSGAAGGISLTELSRLRAAPPYADSAHGMQRPAWANLAVAADGSYPMTRALACALAALVRAVVTAQRQQRLASVAANRLAAVQAAAAMVELGDALHTLSPGAFPQLQGVDAAALQRVRDGVDAFLLPQPPPGRE